MSKENSPRRYPLGPLLTQFRRERGSFLVHGNGAWPKPDSLLHLPDQQLSETLRAFAEHSLPVLWHSVVFGRRLPLLRHALEHLFRGHDSFAERLARCVTPGEAYHIPGLGPGFWSRIAELIDSETPLWCPAVECGLQLLGLLAPCLSDFRTRIAHVLEGYRSIRERSPDLTFPEITDFLERVSRLEGRELPPSAATPCAFAWAAGPEEIRQAIPRSAPACRSASGCAKPLPNRSRHSAASRPWSVPTSTKRHLRPSDLSGPIHSGSRFSPNSTRPIRPPCPLRSARALWCEIVAVMRERFHVHPLEIVDVVIELGDRTKASSCGEFKGFCRDTFAFLKELSEANSAEWMAANRERYRYSVRTPIVELCRAVAEPISARL